MNWNLLPQGLEPNGSLQFDDNAWYNFSHETKEEIKKLRRLQHQQRNINSILSTYGNGDDNSTLASKRSIFSINVPTQQQQAPLPPPPSNQQQQPPSQTSTRSDNAESAFGPRR